MKVELEAAEMDTDTRPSAEHGGTDTRRSSNENEPAEHMVTEQSSSTGQSLFGTVSGHMRAGPGPCYVTLKS